LLKTKSNFIEKKVALMAFVSKVFFKISSFLVHPVHIFIVQEIFQPVPVAPSSVPSGEDTQDDSGFHSGG